MKVTLIQPFYPNIWEPIGLAYIASYCQKHYHGKLEWNFYQAYFDDDESILSGSVDSDIVAFSCTSPSFKHGVDLAAAMKRENPGLITVFGGWHVTALREKVFEQPKERAAIDHVIAGEGEKAFLRILNGCRDRIIEGEAIGFDELSWPDRSIVRNERT